MESTCEDGSFYLAFATDASSDVQLDYNNLPPVFSADGTNVSRASFEVDKDAELCDDPCQPASGGRICGALSCYEVSRRGWAVGRGGRRGLRTSGMGKARSR